MKFLFLSITFCFVVFLSWCGSSSDEVLYSEEDVFTWNLLEESEKPTVSSEIPTTTNEDIITQQDVSL